MSSGLTGSQLWVVKILDGDSPTKVLIKVKSISDGLEQIVNIVGVQEDLPKLSHSSDVSLPGKSR